MIPKQGRARLEEAERVVGQIEATGVISLGTGPLPGLEGAQGAGGGTKERWVAKAVDCGGRGRSRYLSLRNINFSRHPAGKVNTWYTKVKKTF